MTGGDSGRPADADRAVSTKSMADTPYVMVTCEKCGKRQRLYNGNPGDRLVWCHYCPSYVRQAVEGKFMPKT